MRLEDLRQIPVEAELCEAASTVVYSSDRCPKEEEKLFFFSSSRIVHIGVVRSAKPSQRFPLPLELIGRDVYTQLNVYRAHSPSQVIHPADADLRPVYTRCVYSKCKILPAEGGKGASPKRALWFHIRFSQRSRQRPESSQCLQKLLERGEPRVYIQNAQRNLGEEHVAPV